ncbi:DNA polymerase III subunit delta' [Aequorivita sp. H23M31]|uniref:DNA polymerase III subunit delta n=1 Tax=Aequorivita ciconiae TaxID=2494375 RepID=A0A410G4K2_9FLAO|nr:DNA polymerase III subunit delta' [Aequorivita sp. H23M31]QAA82212.1 DNA polymerase III subunit delta' [Aequorivita sp. H23M31]
MDFSEVIGNQHLKSHLIKTVANGRIPHAQLFSGNNGSGLLPMALAYASELLCRQFEKDSPEYIQCKNKVSRLIHPDLHFVFPVNTNDEVKKNAVSDNYAEAWRNFVLDNPYGSLFEWLQSIGIENKQGNISKFEAEQISKKLSLKSFEGGYKVMIIWMAEHMNIECSNKILKLIEEPSDKTVLLLLAEKEGQIITTIHSRCQKLNFPLLSEADIAQGLMKNEEISESLSVQVARRSRGDYNKALHLLNETGEDEVFEKWFIAWVRTAFRAKGNKGAINNLLDWSDELAKQGRETQKKFLSYCIEIFRQALLKNYQADGLLYFESRDKSFSLTKFSPFVHQNNIFEIASALEDASYHIERNGNGKIIFTDLSIKLTRLIHISE